MKAFYLLFVLALVSCSTTKVVETIDKSSYIQEKPYAQKWIGGHQVLARRRARFWKWC